MAMNVASAIGHAERQRALGDAVPVGPLSGLASAVASLRAEQSRATDLMMRLRGVADMVGGPAPGGASDSKAQPIPQGHLGEMTEATSALSTALYLIQCEIERLEGLVG